jgi:fructose-1,6-bisphosphatase/sedoheptulose 1,7-bisphosphatase-like protein
MISGISGGGMPSMDAMRQMQQRMFAKADADGSGGLGAAEFESMLKSSPMGGQAPGGISAADAFKKIDGDGDGQLTAGEMEKAQQQMMERFQSTVQSFGAAGGASADPSADSLQALLDSMSSKGADKQVDAERAMSKTDDLVAQLRSLIERVGSTYGNAEASKGFGLLASA